MPDGWFNRRRSEPYTVKLNPDPAVINGAQ